MRTWKAHNLGQGKVPNRGIVPLQQPGQRIGLEDGHSSLRYLPFDQADIVHPDDAGAFADKVRFDVIRVLPGLQEVRGFHIGPVVRSAERRIEATREELSLALEMAPHLQVDAALNSLGPQLGLVDESGFFDIQVARFKQLDDRRFSQGDLKGPFPLAFHPVVDLDARKPDEAVQAVARVLPDHLVFAGGLGTGHHQPRHKWANEDQQNSGFHVRFLLVSPSVSPPATFLRSWARSHSFRHRPPPYPTSRPPLPLTRGPGTSMEM